MERIEDSRNERTTTRDVMTGLACGVVLSFVIIAGARILSDTYKAVFGVRKFSAQFECAPVYIPNFSFSDLRAYLLKEGEFCSYDFSNNLFEDR